MTCTVTFWTSGTWRNTLCQQTIPKLEDCYLGDRCFVKRRIPCYSWDGWVWRPLLWYWWLNTDKARGRAILWWGSDYWIRSAFAFFSFSWHSVLSVWLMAKYCNFTKMHELFQLVICLMKKSTGVRLINGSLKSLLSDGICVAYFNILLKYLFLSASQRPSQYE